MINKVVIAAAGKGTRMLQHSQDKPKHLIEVNGFPFLYYLLDRLKEAGFTEMIVVIGYQPEVMQQALAKIKADFPLTIINQFDKLDGKYGTASPIECVRDLVKGENFVAVYGDSLWSVKDLKKMRIDDNFNYLAGLKSEHPEKYGVLMVDQEHNLITIKEKPQEYVGNLINTGLYKFTPEIFNKIKLIEKSVRGEYELTDAINLLAQEKKVKVNPLNDYWFDFGRPEDIEIVGQFLKNNQK